MSATIELPYLEVFRDRHDHMRVYFRRKGRRMPLPGLIGSTEFLLAYQAALAESGVKVVRTTRGDAGTFDRLVSDYFQSPDFLRMKPSTRRAYERVILRWLKEDSVGHRLVAQMSRDHVKRMVAKRADTPGAANDVMKKIRVLMTFAIDAKLRADNPAAKIKKFASGEHHTWSDPEISLFESRWPVGGKERLAFALHTFTGQRTSDVRRMSWSDIDDEELIRVVQQKTGTKIWIPLHPELRAILAVTRREHLALLTTAYGKPFSTKGLGNFMADKIGAAGLPEECVTHGLRKAAARRLAEAGCSTREIASITGHQSLAEVERYTKDADQRRLAKSAMARVVEHDANKNCQPGTKKVPTLANSATKSAV